ncbi:hypothetical protein Cgig2_006122 [Carnegiea gigantea]|uniref:Uncharacterized protein n=1 Tax=Carnegiea gigantea TaxID=171969 RepID=A0A9Q1KYY3_9CARY|nr:hypothetical protein Cgig2_006122 [Carnegiea gigantea]
MSQPNYQRPPPLTIWVAHPFRPFAKRKSRSQAKNFSLFLSVSVSTQKGDGSEVRNCHLLSSLSFIFQRSTMASNPSSSEKLAGNSAGKPEKPPAKQPVSQVASILKAYWIPLTLFALFVLFQLVLLPNSFPPSHYDVLQISRKSSIEQVKEAYENFVSKWDSETELPTTNDFVKVIMPLTVLFFLLDLFLILYTTPKRVPGVAIRGPPEVCWTLDFCAGGGLECFPVTALGWPAVCQFR